MRSHTISITRLAVTAALGASLALGSATAVYAADDLSAADEGDEEYIATSPTDALFGDEPGLATRESGISRAAEFQGQIDAHYPHKSGSEASGHVTWTLVWGTSQKIKLTATLKARTSWLTFRTMAGPTPATVYPGGGAGRAAVARYACKGSGKRDWYTYGEGFAPGHDVPFGAHSSSIQSVACDGGLP